MAFENTPLKYLFKILFDDGTIFEQTPEDVSSVDPKKSAFYDVLQDSRVPQALVLLAVDGTVQAAVSLQDGHFEVEGVPFFIGDAPGPGEPLELIYFRRNFREMVMGETVEQVSHVIHYYFGWKRIEDGVEVRRTMFLL